MENICKKLLVPKDVCYIRFGNQETEYGFDGTNFDGKNITGKTFYTVRDEMLIIDFDKNEKIVGIELIGSSKAIKPCQLSQTKDGRNNTKIRK